MSADVLDPTTGPETTRHGPQPGIGLCLSGGGYRAMLFHLGALWRLGELGILQKCARISSVSGGSIVAAMLGVMWKHLHFSSPRAFSGSFGLCVVHPIRHLAGQSIDVPSFWKGFFTWNTAGDYLAKAYAKHLFGDATLQDLPVAADGAPQFILNATNIQTGVLWRFCRDYIGDYRVGLALFPKLPLALAVAASSAFPPILSPVCIDLRPYTFTYDEFADLQRPPYTTTAYLCDGGVYDNMGLETVFKTYQTVLVSDGSMKMAPEPKPATDWARHGLRVVELLQSQTRALRKRILQAALRTQDGEWARKGAYWGMADAIPGAPEIRDRTLELARVPTRLTAIADELQERLINWGYISCETAMQRHMPIDGIRPSPQFPYARGV